MTQRFSFDVYNLKGGYKLALFDYDYCVDVVYFMGIDYPDGDDGAHQHALEAAREWLDSVDPAGC